MRKVIIVGGGLAGLVSAISLRKQGIDVLLIEKKSYPFHRVCGEYVSNEVRGFLENLDIFPSGYHPCDIRRLELSSTQGKSACLNLEMGGFGLSRYSFDYFLYEKACACGVEFLVNNQVLDIFYQENGFQVEVEGQAPLSAELVIGTFGKRSKLDKILQRKFFERKSPYIGVKYHIKYEHHAADTIALHNFSNGYCGINKVEGDKYNLCYLSARSNLAQAGSIRAMEEHVLCQNPKLEQIFSQASFLFDKPLVINEISFETKQPVEQHVLMAGDAAGMITPLCGNGMAMAIHSAKILSEEVMQYFDNHHSRSMLERFYTREWNTLFKQRLWAGRQIQKLFGARWVSGLAVNIARRSKVASGFLVKQTHGKPF